MSILEGKKSNKTSYITTIIIIALLLASLTALEYFNVINLVAGF